MLFQAQGLDYKDTHSMESPLLPVTAGEMQKGREKVWPCGLGTVFLPAVPPHLGLERIISAVTLPW